jgi:hypothetical protein
MRALNLVYDGSRDPRTGHLIFPGAGFLYGGLAAAYHRHRPRPESRADQKHRTEFAPLLVQQFGRDRNSRSSRLGNPEDTAARPGALVNPHGELLSFYRPEPAEPF